VHVQQALEWCEGVMLGREAYHRPYQLWEMQKLLGAAPAERPMESRVMERMADYAERQIAKGDSLSSITRHMLGLYSGRPGAREFRRLLSEGARSVGADASLLRTAISQLSLQ
jgi:tRNA-dihydrouridine synthase A